MKSDGSMPRFYQSETLTTFARRSVGSRGARSTSATTPYSLLPLCYSDGEALDGRSYPNRAQNADYPCRVRRALSPYPGEVRSPGEGSIPVITAGGPDLQDHSLR